MKLRAPLAFAVFLLVTATSFGQILDQGAVARSGTFANQGGAYYNFSGGTGCDIKVSVWGHVNNPGRYNVPCETNLMEIISFSGGARKGAYLDHVRVIRKGGVDQPDQIARVYEIDLDKYTQITNGPVTTKELDLMPGDVVMIDGQEPVFVDPWLRISQTIVAITSLITATVAVLTYSSK